MDKPLAHFLLIIISTKTLARDDRAFVFIKEHVDVVSVAMVSVWRYDPALPGGHRSEGGRLGQGQGHIISRLLFGGFLFCFDRFKVNRPLHERTRKLTGVG